MALMLAALIGLLTQEMQKTKQVSTPQRDDAAAEKLGWKLSMQSWSLRRYTLFEAIDLTAKLGLRYIEIYPGQLMSKENRTPAGHEMSAQDLESVKAKLAQAGIRAVAYGVVDLSADEEECRKVFDFAKALTIEQINSEPPAEAFDTVAKLVGEYGIKVGIHNHPKPSRYWSPERVQEVIAGRSSAIGFCADTGHWVRSSLDPIAVLKANAGRIIGFHLKELNEYGNVQAHDVPWGSGHQKMRGILEEMRRQNFRGVCSIEYEHDTAALLDDIARCIAFFDATAKELASSEPEEKKEAGS
ncbi:MAG: sugar phosphate isomerase/epimerase family protein [Planctomycetota bacterium]